MARGNQRERQWRLLQLIDRPAGVTVEDAASDLGCHIRHHRAGRRPAGPPYIRERLWHPTQKLGDLPDGRPELTLQVAGTQEGGTGCRRFEPRRPSPVELTLSHTTPGR